MRQASCGGGVMSSGKAKHMGFLYDFAHWAGGDEDHPDIDLMPVLPEAQGRAICSVCKAMTKRHGLLVSNGVYSAVCPGDAIISIGNQHRAISPEQFEKQFTVIEKES